MNTTHQCPAQSPWVSAGWISEGSGGISSTESDQQKVPTLTRRMRSLLVRSNYAKNKLKMNVWKMLWIAIGKPEDDLLFMALGWSLRNLWASKQVELILLSFGASSGVCLLHTWRAIRCHKAGAESDNYVDFRQQGAKRSKSESFAYFLVLNPHLFFFFSPKWELSSWEVRSPNSLLLVWWKREATVENALGLLPDLGLVCAALHGTNATLLLPKKTWFLLDLWLSHRLDCWYCRNSSCQKAHFCSLFFWLRSF